MVAGHPFKGGAIFSTGQLLHPDMKRFMISTPVLFVPPFPGKNPYDTITKPQVPSFNDFFNSYFGKYIISLLISLIILLYHLLDFIIVKYGSYY